MTQKISEGDKLRINLREMLGQQLRDGWGSRVRRERESTTI
jgi:hypothetical protein